MGPVNRRVTRPFITTHSPGDALYGARAAAARGIAFGGDAGVARVDFSADSGKSWQAAQLGKDEGKYGFRQWQMQFTLPAKGDYLLMVRCTNSNGVAQPDAPNWNPSGFMRNVIESTPVVAS